MTGKFRSLLSMSLRSGVILPWAAMVPQVPAVAQTDEGANKPPIQVDGVMDAKAKRKAEIARKIAERDAREASEATGLGSHIRDGSRTGGLSQEEYLRREAGKDANSNPVALRVPMEGPTATSSLPGYTAPATRPF